VTRREKESAASTSVVESGARSDRVFVATLGVERTPHEARGTCGVRGIGASSHTPAGSLTG